VDTDHNSQGHRRTDGLVVGQTGARFGGMAGRRRRATVEPPEEGGDVAAHDHREDQPVVGLTGARFASFLSRRRHKQPEQDSEQQAAETIGTPAPTGQQQAVPPPEIAPPVPEPDRVFEPAPVEVADWDTPKETYGLVRPYSWTGGRTASCVDLAVETLVSATGQGVDPTASPEHRTIIGLCAAPRSVAELAALMKMPLGVARVLLGDLAAAGSVAVHRTAGSADAAPDVALMQQVLTGLQRL
jgi:hypothetical protein